MTPDSVLEGGLIGGAITAIIGGTIQVLLWRIRGRTAERLRGLTLSDTRDQRSLDAERQAFKYLQESLERSQKEEEDLRVDLERLRDERDRERQAKLEALEDSASMRRLAQDERFKHDLEMGALKAAIRAGLWREKEAVLWIKHALAAWEAIRPLRRRGDAPLPDLPPVPYWVEQRDPSEPPALPPPDED